MSRGGFSTLPGDYASQKEAWAIASWVFYLKLIVNRMIGMEQRLQKPFLTAVYLHYTFSWDAKQPEVALTLNNTGSLGNRVGVDLEGAGGGELREGWIWSKYIVWTYKILKEQNYSLKRLEAGSGCTLQSISPLRKQRQSYLCEFETSWVYVRSFRQVKQGLKTKEFLTSYLESKGKCRMG